MIRPAQKHIRTSPSGEVFEATRVYLPQELKQQLQQLAKSRGQTLTYAVTAAVRAAVDSSETER